MSIISIGPPLIVIVGRRRTFPFDALNLISICASGNTSKSRVISGSSNCSIHARSGPARRLSLSDNRLPQ